MKIGRSSSLSFWFVVGVVDGGGLLQLVQSTVVEFPPVFETKLLKLAFRFDEDSNVMESISFQFPKVQAVLPSANGIKDTRLSDELYNSVLANRITTFIFENERVESIHISSNQSFYLTYDSSGTDIIAISPFPPKTRNLGVNQARVDPFNTAEDHTPITTSRQQQRDLLTSCQACRIGVATGCTVLQGGGLAFPLWKAGKLMKLLKGFTLLKEGAVVAARKRTLELAKGAWKQFQYWLKTLKQNPKNKIAKKKAEQFRKLYKSYVRDAQKLLNDLTAAVNDSIGLWDKVICWIALGTLEACLTNVDTICKCDFWGAQSSGDPHIYTFDGLSYDCHSHGEVILTKTLNSNLLEVQGRFAPVGWGFATGTTGVVIKPRGLPMIQMSLNSSLSLVFIVDGNEQPLASGNGYQAVQEGWTSIVSYPSIGLEVNVKFNGIYINIGMRILKETLVGETLVGLFGTANGDHMDDWMTPNGTTVTAASGSGLIFESSFDYCNTNWCIRNASESLFTYLADESFDSFSHCDNAYDSSIESTLANPPQCLVDTCGSDLQCLLDGVLLGRAGVENFQSFKSSQLCLRRAKKSCYFSCADALATTCDTSPGLYKICSHDSAAPRNVYCDQQTDGGGWMLLYSYKHVAGEDRPINGSTIPLDPENGYSHFHLNQLLGYHESAIERVRFYCRTSNHNGVIHFQNANPIVGSIAYYGSDDRMDSSAWNDDVCSVSHYPDHSATLPETNMIMSGAFNGFLDSVFRYIYSPKSISFWSIGMDYDRGFHQYDCDDYDHSGTSASSKDTLHNVWVKMKEKCCAFGYGHFTGHVAHYGVSITIDKDGIRTDYPNLSCGHTANMSPNSSTVGRVEWLEVIDYGTCATEGTISLVAGNENVWTYSWTGYEVQEGPLSFDCNRTCGLN